VTYSFGDVRVDIGRLTAFRGESAIPLEPKAFDVLRYLIEQRDRLVTKDELLDAVWPGTFVTPNALTRAVAHLRKALGDDAHDAKYIETIAKRGYRFIAPVAVTSDGPALPGAHTGTLPISVPAPVPVSSRSGRRRLGAVIASFGSDPAWSPDSTRLVFTSDAGGMTSQSLLWTVRADGSDARELTRLGQPPGGHRAPAWSHDGRLVAFIVSQGGWTNEIWTIGVARGTTRRITAAPSGSSPCFAPDDRALYWGGPNKEGNGRLWRQEISADADPIGEPSVALPVAASIIDGVTIAPSGGIAFGLVNEDSNLWAVDIDAAGRGAGDAVRLTDDVARNTEIDYSRDGRIVYTQMAVGLAVSIVVSRDDGSARSPLLAGTDAWNPQWDPSMKRVLIIGGPSGRDRLGWLDMETRRTTTIPLQPGDMRHPRLSPDGRELAFHVIEPSGVMNVWTQPLDGARVQVTSDGEAMSYPAWSPDGRSLAVEIKRGDRTHVGVVARTGGPVEQLTFGPGQSWPRSWAPDNDRIAFAGLRDGVWNVYSVSRSTRAITPLTHFTSASGYVRDPAWSPRGNRIVFERALRTGGVWTIATPTPSSTD
jgi:Tol biopolymer transport system component/DNA-binding winged helix-turn-helix (wHTH) protein